MTTRTLAVVSAGLGQPSSTSLLATRLATAATNQLSRRDVDAQVATIELRQHAHALTDNLLTFFASEALQDAKDTLANADGLIALTPIFSASYTGVFKTFFDLLDDHALTGTPVLLGATAGTARHSLALEHTIRPLFSHLRALTTPPPPRRPVSNPGGSTTVSSTHGDVWPQSSSSCPPSSSTSSRPAPG